jgi:hypothetical protein
MVIGEAEGTRFRFEVLESIDGFGIRRVAIGSVDRGERAEILFRTASAAFAYAEMAASRDCLAAGDAGEDDVVAHGLRLQRFARLRQDLADHGVSGAMLGEWVRAEARERRRHIH